MRYSHSFDLDWKFLRGDVADGPSADLDDAGWQRVTLPHDWSIEGPFDLDHPSGWGGGYLPGGVGWYRKEFRLPESARGSTAWVEFDGVYKNCDVYINGHHLGFHPYGYTSFHYDLAAHLEYGQGKNVLAVRVDDSAQPDARWYTGAGIYRHTWLTICAALHVAHWGTFVWAPKASPDLAQLEVLTRVQNESGDEKLCTLLTRIVDQDGNVVAEQEAGHPLAGREEHEFIQRFYVERPTLWSLDHPYLYVAHSVVKDGDQAVDESQTPFGIRDICFDVDHGFLLNGQKVKVNGVCLHHDGGCVGAAVPERVWERRLEILKDMGCNAIRSSHYPPAPELLDLCDQMGFLVMDEAFDEWKIGKFRYGYHDYYDKWAIADLKSMLHRDRNHPSVVMWSVGNEIPEQSRPNGHEMLKRLVDVAHHEDPSRPVVSACDNIAAPVPTRLEFLELLDIVGYNYADRWGILREKPYSVDRHLFPQRKMIGSENVSVGGVRGDYTLQGTREWWGPYHSRMVEAEQLWKFTWLHDYVAGDFMWTGIDYLGETHWPNKNSSSGVIDMCGFPKDGYYFYQSQWMHEPMLHLFPHWNWPGKEGQIIPVLCYTNCESVELFLNDRSYGIKSYAFPRPGMKGVGWAPEVTGVHLTTADLHLAWDVPYEPGTLRAVGTTGGQVVCVQEIVTTGAPAQIALECDRQGIAADGQDVAHITVRVLDNQGNLVPTAENPISFDVLGEGQIIGLDNGDPASHEDFRSNQRKAFHGLALAIVQSTPHGGQIQVTATSPGLRPGTTTVSTVVKGA